MYSKSDARRAIFCHTLPGLGLILALAVQPWSAAQAQNQSGAVDPEQAGAALADAIDPEQAAASTGEVGTSGAVMLDADSEQMEALELSPGAPASGGMRLAYVWANNPTAASYTPSTTYSHNSSGSPVSINRSSAGRYAVTFAGLGGSGVAGGNVQVTGYGGNSADCKVRFWSSAGANFTANVACFNANGTPSDSRYTVLMLWPSR